MRSPTRWRASRTTGSARASTHRRPRSGCCGRSTISRRVRPSSAPRAPPPNDRNARPRAAEAAGKRRRRAGRRRAGHHHRRAGLDAARARGADAGHGRAVAAALAPLPVRLRWVDDRPGEFPAVAERPANAEIVATAHVAEQVRVAPPGAAFLVMTHSHPLDYELCEAILRRGDFAYAG